MVVWVSERGQGTSLVVQWLRLHPSGQGLQVRSLARGELRAYVPHSQKIKTQKRSSVVTNSVKTLKMVHIKKKKNLKSKRTEGGTGGTRAWLSLYFRSRTDRTEVRGMGSLLARRSPKASREELLTLCTISRVIPRPSSPLLTQRPQHSPLMAPTSQGLRRVIKVCSPRTSLPLRTIALWCFNQISPAGLVWGVREEGGSKEEENRFWGGEPPAVFSQSGKFSQLG